MNCKLFFRAFVPSCFRVFKQQTTDLQAIDPRTTTISYAKSFHKQTLMDIWKTAFPADSDDFVKFYFEKKYCKENTLLLFKNDEIASCLQMLPYKMTYYKEHINTAYISGACTVPAHQNQGLMKNLLVHAFGEMRKRDNLLTTLIPQEPWLIDFYKKMGYAPCFDYKLTPICPEYYPVSSSNKTQLKEFEHDDLRATYYLYKRFFQKQNVRIQKSLFDFSVMVQAFQKFEGKVYVLKDRNNVVGVCFCFISDGKIIVKDRVTKNVDYRQCFFLKLTQLFDNQPIFLSSGTTNVSQSFFLGMARIVDAEKLMTLFAQAHPQAEFSIKISDEHILKNNLTLSVSKGEIAETTLQTVDFEVSIGKLTQLLLGYQTRILGKKYAVFPQQHPYMSLMLE